jgi:hypothetical protein
VVHKEDTKNSLVVFLKANKEKSDFQTGRRLKKADGTYQKFSKWFFQSYPPVTKGVPVVNLEGVLTHWYGTCTPVVTEAS